MRVALSPRIRHLLHGSAGTLAAAAIGAALATGCLPAGAAPAPSVTGASVAPATPAAAAVAAGGASAAAASPSGESTELPPAEAAAAVSGGTAATGGSAFVSRVRDKASDMVLTAMSFLGVPYRRGGQTPEQGFDCSGLTRKVFETSLGLVLPRRADEQAKTAGLVPIRREELRPGDLVFFNTLRKTFSHVGIYIGDGKFIHAPRTGAQVRIEDLRFVYWAKRFTGARRADEVADVPPVDAPAPPTRSTLTPAYAEY